MKYRIIAFSLFSLCAYIAPDASQGETAGASSSLQKPVQVRCNLLEGHIFDVTVNLRSNMRPYAKLEEFYKIMSRELSWPVDQIDVTYSTTKLDESNIEEIIPSLYGDPQLTVVKLHTTRLQNRIMELEGRITKITCEKLPIRNGFKDRFTLVLDGKNTIIITPDSNIWPHIDFDVNPANFIEYITKRTLFRLRTIEDKPLFEICMRDFLMSPEHLNDIFNMAQEVQKICASEPSDKEAFSCDLFDTVLPSIRTESLRRSRRSGTNPSIYPEDQSKTLYCSFTFVKDEGSKKNFFNISEIDRDCFQTKLNDGKLLYMSIQRHMFPDSDRPKMVFHISFDVFSPKQTSAFLRYLFSIFIPKTKAFRVSGEELAKCEEITDSEKESDEDLR